MDREDFKIIGMCLICMVCAISCIFIVMVSLVFLTGQNEVVVFVDNVSVYTGKTAYISVDTAGANTHLTIYKLPGIVHKKDYLSKDIKIENKGE